MASYRRDTPEENKRVAKYVIVMCEDEHIAKELLDEIVDQHPEVSYWPYLAYDDGFGHLVQVGGDEPPA